MSQSVFTESLDFHGKALLLRSERQKAIASNIANADTPGFRARDFDFAAALREATASGSGSSQTVAPAVRTTHPAHLTPSVTPTGRTDVTALSFRAPDQPSLDANTVDLDRERAQFADNAVRYEASLRFINGSVRTTLSAIRGE